MIGKLEENLPHSSNHFALHGTNVITVRKTGILKRYNNILMT